jgi:hypothetical protein
MRHRQQNELLSCTRGNARSARVSWGHARLGATLDWGMLDLGGKLDLAVRSTSWGLELLSRERPRV